jgi:aspartyl protease family protein
MMFALLLIVILCLGGALLFALFGGESLDAIQGLPVAASVIGVLILLYLATLHGSRGERRSGQWPAILLLALVGGVAAISYWHVDPPALFDSLMASARSDDGATASPANAPASVRIRRSAVGFLANCAVNGAAVPMLLDSGAATVVLRQSDAEKAGVDVGSLDFDTPLKTANGMSYVAAVRLKSVRVGPLELDDVEALVAKPGTLNENLLGMSFLRRLESYEVAGDFVTLRQ